MSGTTQSSPTTTSTTSTSPPDADGFLEECRASSAEAYAQLTQLLAALENVQTRREHRVFLETLFTRMSTASAEENLDRYHFSLSTLPLPTGKAETNKLQLLQLPSVFTPEDWSFTFYEGLLRHGKERFTGKRVVELGSGTGWVSIALAKCGMPESIYGLDINPKASLCGRINAFLNGLDADGVPVLEGGKTVFDRVHFATSDLLSFSIEQHHVLDYVIGCVPQMLETEDSKLTANEGASDTQLCALSNYCLKQGQVEDKYGLGLVARSLEQAVQLLSASGMVIMILAGRPGKAVLERMFLRRGLSVKKLWQRKIQQARDTDIKPLVQLEQATPNRCEFYMDLSSQEPINATTASYFVQAGGTISHTLMVLEGACEYQIHGYLREIYSLLQQPAYAPVKHTMDLSANGSGDESAERKAAHLASLATLLRKSSAADFHQDLRQQLMLFLRSHFAIPLHAENLLVVPSIQTLLRMFMFAFKPELTLATMELVRELPEYFLKKTSSSGMPAVLEGPQQAHLIVDLVQKLKPQLAIVRLAEYENKSPDSFFSLLQATEKQGTRLIIDISNSFEVINNPCVPVLQYIATQPLPPHVTIVCGCRENQVHGDLGMAFMVSENATLLNMMQKVADLTCGPTPILSTHYYGILLDNALTFHMTTCSSNLASPRRHLRIEDPEQMSAFCKSAPIEDCTFWSPKINPTAGCMLEENVNLARFKPLLYEAFARRHIDNAEYNPDAELTKLLRRRYGLGETDTHLPTFIYESGGVAPLFAFLVEVCLQEGGTFVIPAGSSSCFSAVARFYGVPVVEVPGHKSKKITAVDLELVLGPESAPNVTRPWVLFNFPAPTGGAAAYTQGEVHDILSLSQLSRKNNARVIVNTSFPMGSTSSTSPRFYKLDQYLGTMQIASVLLGDLASELALEGGVFYPRLGYAQTTDEALTKYLTAFPANGTPPLQYAFKHLLQVQVL
eukprot:TRINITY_DN3328_c0_g2_i1.p1 TRINITY_DN3328_c0_g2~~TRINITY_DN3328_c0_g2_i1.p1  ORF type:complete len:961 (+),score=271.71 TRINITY_DN3328_c0_g2_i1:89-2971(+)